MIAVGEPNLVVQTAIL